jgi:hypothetical protein
MKIDGKSFRTVWLDEDDRWSWIKPSFLGRWTLYA